MGRRRADSGRTRRWHATRPAHRRGRQAGHARRGRSEEHTSELQSRLHLVCRLLLEKKKKKTNDSFVQSNDDTPSIPITNHVHSFKALPRALPNCAAPPVSHINWSITTPAVALTSTVHSNDDEAGMLNDNRAAAHELRVLMRQV